MKKADNSTYIDEVSAYLKEHVVLSIFYFLHKMARYRKQGVRFGDVVSAFERSDPPGRAELTQKWGLGKWIHQRKPLSKVTVNKYLSRLNELGLVDKIEKGRTTRYRIAKTWRDEIDRERFLRSFKKRYGEDGEDKHFEELMEGLGRINSAQYDKWDKETQQKSQELMDMEELIHEARTSQGTFVVSDLLLLGIQERVFEDEAFRYEVQNHLQQIADHLRDIALLAKGKGVDPKRIRLIGEPMLTYNDLHPGQMPSSSRKRKSRL
jgi:DNA-binding transcriptional ArsR family regulator